MEKTTLTAQEFKELSEQIKSRNNPQLKEIVELVKTQHLSIKCADKKEASKLWTSLYMWKRNHKADFILKKAGDVVLAGPNAVTPKATEEAAPVVHNGKGKKS